MTRPWTLVAILICVGVMCLALWPDADAADPPRGPALRVAHFLQENAEGPEYSGVFACLGCHTDGEQTLYRGSLERLRMDEVDVWHRQDTHRLAYCVLKGDLATHMSERLGYDVSKAEQCRACHAPRPERRGGDDAETPNYRLSEGVTCEDCHGASRGWHRLHVVDAPWKGLPLPERTRVKKEHGLRELADPATRAAVCADCHVGNDAAGQFVTHDMYAAGHPPLASVDVVQYAEAMPAHWRTDSAGRPQSPPADDEKYLATRQALVGYLTAAERTMRMTASPIGMSHDFAIYDCDACHHELTLPSWRQARFAGAVPGRPSYRAWALNMAAIVTSVAGSDADKSQTDARLRELHDALRTSIFNKSDPEPLAMLQLAVADAYLAQLQSLAQQPLDQVAVDRLVVTLQDEALNPALPPDFDTARSYAVLLRTALIDLQAFDPHSESPAVDAWQELERQLGLAATVRKPNNEPFSLACDADPEEPVAAGLPAALAARESYDPVRFQAALQQFADHVRGGGMSRKP